MVNLLTLRSNKSKIYTILNESDECFNEELKKVESISIVAKTFQGKFENVKTFIFNSLFQHFIKNTSSITFYDFLSRTKIN